MTGNATPTPRHEPGSGSSAASKRREANRLAAARFRTRKKDQVTELENRVHDLEAENFHLKAVNRTLRKRCQIPDAEIVQVDDEFAVGRPAWQREVAGERFLSDRVSEGPDFLESPTAQGDSSNSKKRRRTGGGKGGDPSSSSYHHLDRSVSASGDNADPFVMLQDENDRLQNQMRAYEERMRMMNDELVGIKYRTREETGGHSGSSDQSPETTGYRDQRQQPTYAPQPTYTPFTLDPALTGAINDGRYNALSPSTSAANPVLTLASAASNARQLQREGSGQLSMSLPPLSPAMRIAAISGGGYASPSASGNLNVNPLDPNARVSPSMSHQQPYGSRPGSPMNIRAFDALNAAVAAVDAAAAAQEASLSSPSGGNVSVARHAWNMQPNNNLGTLITGLSRTTSRGMDSPVSAERSGMLEDEEDESDEAAAAAAAAAGAAHSGARHLAGTSVLSSSRDGSPIGSSLEYFDRRMGGGSGISGTRVTSGGRGGSKLRDMDIDASEMEGIDAAVKLEPSSSSYPHEEQHVSQDLVDPALHTPMDIGTPVQQQSSMNAVSDAAPPQASSARAEDDGATPTGENYTDTERVPRIAFQEVQ
ncbi:hypothetical protein QFC22_002499 [Naganishia vaughanmartiniae]|uniref:Uncharacterized protein n=1 Tax=Naganishia vaughanmartiniae TaxID=1424756 RepID=A0ACC2XB06_9TREE|nr:hypothetical protein QFC22_002499 [Naganishia vaughanmartiniae]